MIATCPEITRLHDYALGKLTEQESDEIFGHLSNCQLCQKCLEDSDPAQDSFLAHLQDVSAADPLSAESAFGRATTRAKDPTFLLELPGSTSNAGSIGWQREVGSAPLPAIIGEYQIDRLLGQGGMGVVYLGHHTKLGRAVALKVLAGHRLADPDMHERFASEMRAVGKLSHPNIVVAHDAREIDGMAVLVTEYIDGLTVGDILKRVGRLSLPNAAKIAHDVASALSAIDQASLIHRDIKPSNIMVSRCGQVKLLDLGLARLQSNDDLTLERTVTGRALGTVDYIAPEQITHGRQVDIRADIYSLGCTLFKLLTGHGVFYQTQTMTIYSKMMAHVETPPPSLAQFIASAPEDLITLVNKMLEKDPNRRPQTPEEVVQRLAKLSEEADLTTLVEQATQADGTADPLGATSPALHLHSQSVSRSDWFRSSWLMWLVAAGFCGGFWSLGLALGWLSEVEILIRHSSGVETKLKVARGSVVTIDEFGHATVELPEPSATSSHSVDRPLSRNPLEGVWKFKGPGRFDGAYLILAPEQFAIWSGSDGAVARGNWRNQPNTTPPQLDLDVLEDGHVVPQLGIYETATVAGEPDPVGLTVWFNRPGQERLKRPTSESQRVELHRVDSTQLEPGRVPVLQPVWEIWQELSQQPAVEVDQLAPPTPPVGTSDRQVLPQTLEGVWK